MAKTALKRASSAIVKRTVAMPIRLKNADLRTREYLTDDEVQRLAEAAKANRHGHRDAIKHGLVLKRGRKCPTALGEGQPALLNPSTKAAVL